MAKQQEVSPVSPAREKLDLLLRLLQTHGLGQTQAEKEAWQGLIDLGRELADALEEVRENQEDLGLYIETIDEDLSNLEERVYGVQEEEGEEDDPSYLD